MYIVLQAPVETINMNGGMTNNTSPVHLAAPQQDNEVNYSSAHIFMYVN